jgi:anthranilate synthase component 1
MGIVLNIKEVREIADELSRPCLIPVVATVEGCADPAGVYLSIRAPRRPSYLLESAEGPGEAARYSVIGYDALLYVAVRDGVLEIGGRPDIAELAMERAEQVRHVADPLEVLKEAMFLKTAKVPAVSSRYMLGAVGYISYDFVRSIVDIGNHTVDDLRHPDVEFMLPERTVIFDHLEGRTHYCSLLFLTDGSDVDDGYGRALVNVEELAAIRPTSKPGVQPKISMRSNIQRADFENGVDAVKKYIRAGDVIQAVLSRRIELEPAPDLDQFYTNLKRINPSPYMFFLDFPKRSVVGSSPEILVKVDGRDVVTRPIAGTRRRGKNGDEDEALERELLGDGKERAEHVMLVDLARNDIGRVSDFGTVRMRDFMKVEKYSHVQHLVTTVVGRLRKDRDEFDALRATFPAGTVTGAPKVRAMEIIEELEPTRRGIYAGAIGSFTYTGQADLAITIRTLVAERGRAYIQVGAGIVSDSVPWKEYYETENKARALLAAAGI